MSQLGYSINLAEVSTSSFLVNYPVVVTNPGGTVTTNTVSGNYLTIGKLVFISVYFSVNAVVGGAPNLEISLPFPVDLSYPATSLPNGISFTGQVQTPANKAISTYYVAGRQTVALFLYDGTTLATVGNLVSVSGCYIRT